MSTSIIVSTLTLPPSPVRRHDSASPTPGRSGEIPAIPHLATPAGYQWLQTVPAHLILEADAPSPDLVAGRVVVIGGSFVDSGDIHLTPLADMPGALIIVNAVQSLAQYGEARSIPTWAKYLVEAGLIVVMSIAFAVFSSFWGMVVSGVLVVLALLPLTFWLFRSGVWLDFALPLIGVQLHQLAAEFEEGRKAKHKEHTDKTEKEK